MLLFRSATNEFLGETNSLVGIRYLIESYLRTGNNDCHNIQMLVTSDNKIKVQYVYNYLSESPIDGEIEFYIRE